MATYGSGGSADHLGTLVKRVAVVVVEGDHGSLAWRQTAKAAVKVAVWLVLDPAIGVSVIGQPEPWQDSAAHIDGAAHADLAQPGASAGWIAQGRPVFPGALHRLLNRVFGFLDITQNGKGHGEERPAFDADHPFKSRRIAQRLADGHDHVTIDGGLRRPVYVRCHATVTVGGEKAESAVSRVLFPPSAGLAGAPWGGSHPSRSPVTRRLQRPYPRTGRASRLVLLFGLAPGGVYQASRSPGCWWALTHTISPSPSLARRLCLFCGTLLRVAPTGCYPAPCSTELGLSSTGRSRRDCLADSAPIVPAAWAGITHGRRAAAKTMSAAEITKVSVRPTWIRGPDNADPIGWPAKFRPIETAKASMATGTAVARVQIPMTRRSRPSLSNRPAINADGTEANPKIAQTSPTKAASSWMRANTMTGRATITMPKPTFKNETTRAMPRRLGLLNRTYRTPASASARTARCSPAVRGSGNRTIISAART